MELAPGSIVSFSGELGAGKTVIIRGICDFLCPGISISSPSFTLINTYPGSLCDVHHIDLYRIENDIEIDELGIEDYLYGEDITLIEWGEKLGSSLPGNIIKFVISITGERLRLITIQR